MADMTDAEVQELRWDEANRTGWVERPDGSRYRMTDAQSEAHVRGLENDFEADMQARYEGAGDPGTEPEPYAECGAIYTTISVYGGGQDICTRRINHEGRHDWRGEEA